MSDSKVAESDHRRAHVVLVVPLGVESVIFPWGVISIKEYLDKTGAPASTRIWNLGHDADLKALQGAHARTLQSIEAILNTKGLDVFFLANSRYSDVFFGAVASLGSGFLRIAGANGLLSGARAWVNQRRLRHDADALKRAYEALVVRKLEQLAVGVSQRRQIWAFSVYDRTLFGCLGLATLARRTFADSTVVLGGDYFTFPVARKLVRAQAFIDGVVVGYGEEVMRQVVESNVRDEAFADVAMRGVVNRASLAVDEPESPTFPTKRFLRLVDQKATPTLQAVNVPRIYYDAPLDSPIDYVQSDLADGRKVRVLAQRGCSYGKCTFCTQLDKRLHFTISVQHVVDSLHRQIEERASAGNVPVVISFDSDEHTISVVTALLDYLDSERCPRVPIVIRMWMQVKMFKPSLIRAWAAFRNRNVHFQVALGVESFNPETLRHMDKGHTPLEAVQTIKLIQDCGHEFTSNYFMHFPLESRAGVAAEAALLRRTLHLFVQAQGRLSGLCYAANGRDALYEDPERFQVFVDRLPGDVWMRETYGVDLEFSFWAYRLRQRLTREPDRWMVWSWHEHLAGRGRRFGLLREAAFHVLGRMTRRTEFLARARLFQHIADATPRPSGPAPGADLLPTMTEQVPPSHFYIRRRVLLKDFCAPDGSERWSMGLSFDELRVLRALYFTRKRVELAEVLSPGLAPAKLKQILDRHLQLGSIVEQDGSLLSVVNDPEFCEELAAGETRGELRENAVPHAVGAAS
jgi:hypothetical protein